MRIVVTGGAGFLGSHLCEKLIEGGDEVICIDNLLTGSKENIANLLNSDKFRFLEYDVSNGLPEGLEFERLYHLASPASPNEKSEKSYHKLSFETMLVNTQGTWKLAEEAVKKGAKFLFASTSEAYGDPLEHPQSEEYRGNVSTTGPRSVYDESKRFGETVTAAFVRERGLDGRIIRIFNTYGPKMALDDGRLVMEFCLAALENKPFPVFGDGRQTRSFCFVSDLVEGIILAMEKEKLVGEVVNLGNDKEFTVLELAELIKEITGSSSEVEFARELPEDDPLQRRPDISKAKRMLGWEPKVELREGLKKLVESLKSGRVFYDS